MKFVISSNKNYYKQTVPILLSNLSNVDKKDIIVVVGGNDKYSKKKIDGIQHIYVEYTAYTFTGLIEVIENHQDLDYICVLQDTCRVGEEFINNVLGFDTQYDFTAVDYKGWTAMGVYSAAFLQENKNFFLSLKNCNKSRYIVAERLPIRMSRSTSFTHEEPKIMKEADIYGNGVLREAMRYKQLDLVKYRSLPRSNDYYLP